MSTAPQSTDVRDGTGEPDTDLIEESLVEEVSIDGMCGVY